MEIDDPPPTGQSTIDDASMHTITATSLQNPTYDSRPQTSYSDTGFSRPYSQSADNTPDHMQNGHGLSRPPSTQSQGQYDPSGQRQQTQKNPSVVIKVGMVGDAQIGKTSLMVKYVEGSWDEDYIQTLGPFLHFPLRCSPTNADVFSFLFYRCQLHGKDHQHPQHGNHLFHLGFGRTTGIRQHVTTRVQRCRSHSLHVRPDPQVHSQQHQRMVPTRARLQQDRHPILGGD